MVDQAADIALLTVRVGVALAVLLVMTAYLQLVEQKKMTCILYQCAPTPSKRYTAPSDVLCKPFQPEGGEADGERKHQGS